MAFKKTPRKKATVNRTHVLYRGKLFSFFKGDITLPNGRRTEIAMVRHPGSPGMVPFSMTGQLPWYHSAGIRSGTISWKFRQEPWNTVSLLSIVQGVSWKRRWG